MCMSNVSYRFLSDERVDSCYLRTKGEHTRKQNDRRGRKRAGGGGGEKRREGVGNARVRATRRSASRVEQ